MASKLAVHRIGECLLLVDDEGNCSVVVVAREEIFRDRVEAVEFAIEQGEKSTDSQFIDVHHRGW